NAINIRDGDELIDVRVTTGEADVILGTRDGMAIRFGEKDARPIGRATSGVRGINLSKGDVVVGMVTILRPDTTLLVVTESGMGKRTLVDAYRFQQRGGKGVINMKTASKAGRVVAIKSVMEEDELMFITRNGVVNRQRVSEIRTIGRATQGVRLVSLDEKDRVMDVARVIADDADEAQEMEGGLQATGANDEPQED
ncbi:MAG: DNA gyrase C-terminal beta-propeller domain-containing protein, partial [Gemmatimonadota bacterium]